MAMIDVMSLSAWHGPECTYGGAEYGEMINALRGFLAAIAGARPDSASVCELTRALEGWTDRLITFEVGEADQVYARRGDLVGRGQATWPPVRFTRFDEASLEGLVRFNRFFLGRNGVVHGGVVMLIFDEIAGRIAHFAGRAHARTAFLKVDFRAPAPIDVDLRINARFVREDGRKRFVRLELHHDEVLCAEAEALMVTLLPGQR
jgi:acyl-coenzyme A thioesterase PaaI-like protein